jgi:hypothetical protein
MDVAALDPTELLQPLPERGDAGEPFRGCLSVRYEHGDSAHPVGMLSPR